MVQCLLFAWLLISAAVTISCHHPSTSSSFSTSLYLANTPYNYFLIFNLSLTFQHPPTSSSFSTSFDPGTIVIRLPLPNFQPHFILLTPLFAPHFQPYFILPTHAYLFFIFNLIWSSTLLNAHFFLICNLTSSCHHPPTSSSFSTSFDPQHSPILPQF